MNFLKYSNETQSNIIPEEDFESLTQEVFNVIATNLSRSLGPLGSSATIFDGSITEATKDGYSILSKYRFHNVYKRMIYNLIQAPCTKMNNTVGDGTTTAIALANALFNNYKRHKTEITNTYRLPREFKQTWDEVIESIKVKIAESARAISPDDYDAIYNIAYVTSNGDKEVSEAIAKVYQEAKTPGIKQKDSPTNKSYIEAIKGFDFPANFIMDAYAKNSDLSTEEDDVAIMIFDHKIDADLFNGVIMPINDVLRDQDKKLIVVAPFYDELFVKSNLQQYTFIEKNKYHKFNLICTAFQYGKISKHQLEDLAVVMKTRVIDTNLATEIKEGLGNANPDSFMESLENENNSFHRIIGNCKHAWLSFQAGSIFTAEDDIKDDATYIQTLNHATYDLEQIKKTTDQDKQAYSMKIYEANTRVLQLHMNNYIYYVGANSVLQKNILWDSIEDVIKCVRSATKSGVVPGCQITIMKICYEMMDEIIRKAFPEIDPNDTIHLDQLPNEDRLKFLILRLINDSCYDVYYRVLNGPDDMGMIRTIKDHDAIEAAFLASKDKLDNYTPEKVADYNDEVKKALEDDYSKMVEAVKAVYSMARQMSDEIINQSIDFDKTYDLETQTFSDKIITSAETDSMVLTAASELVKILISGNQCIVCDAAMDSVHEEKIDI